MNRDPEQCEHTGWRWVCLRCPGLSRLFSAGYSLGKHARSSHRATGIRLPDGTCTPDLTRTSTDRVLVDCTDDMTNEGRKNFVPLSTTNEMAELCRWKGRSRKPKPKRMGLRMAYVKVKPLDKRVFAREIQAAKLQAAHKTANELADDRYE